MAKDDVNDYPEVLRRHIMDRLAELVSTGFIDAGNGDVKARRCTDEDVLYDELGRDELLHMLDGATLERGQDVSDPTEMYPGRDACALLGITTREPANHPAFEPDGPDDTDAYRSVTLLVKGYSIIDLLSDLIRLDPVDD